MVRSSNYDALSGQQKDLKAIMLPITFYLMEYSSRDQTEDICPVVVNGWTLIYVCLDYSLCKLLVQSTVGNYTFSIWQNEKYLCWKWKAANREEEKDVALKKLLKPSNKKWENLCKPKAIAAPFRCSFQSFTISKIRWRGTTKTKISPK